MSQAVARPLGFVSGGLALCMFMCALIMPMSRFVGVTMRPVDVGSAVPMIVSASICAILGIALWWYGRPATGKTLGRREGTLAVALIWLGTGVCGGLPYLLDTGMAPGDAPFESISGFTTTGSTVVAHIEHPETGLSRPILLWRSLTQWLGGMGIVVLFVAVFPNIGVGGKHLYRSEAPGPVGAGLRHESPRPQCFSGNSTDCSRLRYFYSCGFRVSAHLNPSATRSQVWPPAVFQREMLLSRRLIALV